MHKSQLAPVSTLTGKASQHASPDQHQVVPRLPEQSGILCLVWSLRISGVQWVGFALALLYIGFPVLG